MPNLVAACRRYDAGHGQAEVARCSSGITVVRPWLNGEPSAPA
jgi:hypothetical protein